MENSEKKLKEVYELIRKKGVDIHTKKDFANVIGISYQNLSAAFSGAEKYLTKNLFKKICIKYDFLNIDYFIDDKGEMLKQPNIIQQGEQNINISGNSATNVGNRNYVRGQEVSNSEEQQTAGIPLIPFDFIAGYGEDSPGISLNDCQKYNIPEFENIGAEFLVRVSGSSMYPKYSNGDILACKKIRDILFFQWGKIYVIDSSQGQIIKRVFPHDSEEMIMLVSENEKYPPFPIPKSDIRSLSIVVGAVRME